MDNNTPTKKEELHINSKMLLATLLTFILLIGSLVPMFVGVTMDLIAARDVDVVEDDGSNKKPDKSANADQPAAVIPKAGAKTGIELPSQTPAGSYLGTVGDRFSDISADTDISSAATVLVDMSSNEAVAGKAADERIYPASMTKVMTLLVACENAKDPNALLTLTSDMINKYNSSENLGASLAFKCWKQGYQITVEDALHMVIYGSDTYACWLIANYVSGSEEAFAILMNQRAQQLGLTQTNFTNCTGLFNENHYTTCREMAAIMAAAISNPAAKAILTKIDQYCVDIYTNGTKNEDASVDTVIWSNWYAGRVMEHPFESPNGKAYIYVGNGSDVKFIAGKTGYESTPTNCFVTVGLDDTTQKMYVCVQVGRISKDQGGSISPKTSTLDTRAMYYKYAKDPA